MNKKNILIIGAGPAGLSTALFLAQHKIDCTVIEKSTFPRDKICGDAFSGKVSWALHKLSIFEDYNFPKQTINLSSWGVKFFGTENNELKVPYKLNYNTSETAPGFISKREDFDNFLFEKAKESKYIEIVENCNLTDFQRHNESIISTTADKKTSFSSNIVVAADGAYSKIAKDLMQFSVSDNNNALGLRTYYEGVEGLDEDGFIELHFLKNLLPGYFWIFPLPNGQANVGAGIRTDLMRKKKINFKKEFDKILTEHPIISKRFKNAKVVDKVRLYGLPLGAEKRKISSDNLILVGDSAALIDPFTGEGIGNAVISGMLAAETIVKCRQRNDYSAKILSEYDYRVYRRLLTELKLSKKLQELSKYPWLFNFVVNKARKNKELRETISCMFADVDIRSKFKNPLFYLKILFN